MIVLRKRQFSGSNIRVQPDLSRNNAAEQESLIRQINPGPIPKTPGIDEED
jgi:hypothetical protein